VLLPSIVGREGGVDKDSAADVFKNLDKTGDGTLQRKDLLLVLSQLDTSQRWTENRIDKLLKGANLERDGKIQLDEFLQWIFTH